MSPRGYGRQKPRYFRLDRLQNLKTNHLRRKEARLEGIHPDRDTPPSKTRPENKSELVQGCFRRAVRQLIKSSQLDLRGNDRPHTHVPGPCELYVAATLLMLMTLEVPWGRECAPLMRRDWNARTTKNGAMVLRAKISAQFCTVSGSRGSDAAVCFAIKSGSRRDPAKPAL